MKDFNVTGGGQMANLLSFFTQIDCAWRQLQVKVDWFPLQLYYLEFHVMSLRRGELRVNAGGTQGTMKVAAGARPMKNRSRRWRREGSDREGFDELFSVKSRCGAVV